METMNFETDCSACEGIGKIHACGRDTGETTVSTPALCGACGGRTDGIKSAASGYGFGGLASCECTKQTNSAAIDSSRIDNALLVRTVEHQRAQIGDARWQLQKGLRMRSNPSMANFHFEQALRILGALGAG